MVNWVPHIMFTDTDGDVHVAPRSNVKLDSDRKSGDLYVCIFYPTDYDECTVSQAEFKRLTEELTRWPGQ